jgi:hypothetical protein
MSLIERARDFYNRPSRAELSTSVANLEAKVLGLAMRDSASKANQTVSSGVSMSYGKFTQDHNTKLQGAGKYEIFSQMETDPHIKGALIDKSLPLLTAEWEIEKASDDPRDEEIAEFVSANLLRTSGDRYGKDYWLQTSWKAQRLPEILSMLRDGFAAFNRTWRVVNGKKVYDRLQWIEPQTIDGTKPWELDDQDNIIGLRRKYKTPTDRFVYDDLIPADSLKLYVWDLRGALFEGKSFIRPSYGAWIRKEFILRQAAIWAQKVGAPAPIGFYPAMWSDPDIIARFEEFIQSLRGSAPAEAFGVFPKDSEGNSAEIKYAGAEHDQVDRMRGLIDGENAEIGAGTANRTSNLSQGASSTGSMALGQVTGSKEAKFTEALAAIIGEFENHGAANLTGVIEELVNMNFAGVQKYPELVCTKVDPLANFEETIAAWGAGIIPKTPDARRQITEGALGLNLPDDAYDIEEVLPNQGVPGPDAPADPSVLPPDGTDTPESGDTPPDDRAMSLEAHKERIKALLRPAEEVAPKGGRFRGRTVLEVEYVNLAEVSTAFRVGERDIKVTLRQVEVGMKADLMRRLSAGKVTTRNLDGMRRSKYRGQKKAEAALVVEFRVVGDQGIKHAGDELSRQQES